MTSMLSQTALFLGRWFEFSLVAKATVLVVFSLIASALTRRSRASVRHLILAATLAGLGLLPFVLFVKPVIQIKVFSPNRSIPSSDAGQISRTLGLQSADAGMAPTHGAGFNSTRSVQLWLRAVDLIWLIGAISFVMPLTIGARRAGRFRRVGLPWLEQRERIRAIAIELGITRPVEVLLHEGIVAPFTCGVQRPVILLPVDVRHWANSSLQRALLHELEHIRRKDWITQWVARIICAVYWFHPLIWIVWRKLSLEAERACDDAVIQSAEAVDRAEYAAQLVLLARRMSASSASPVLGLANRSDLSQRVSSLLESTRRRGPVGFWAIATILTVACIFTFALASLKVLAQSSAAQPSKLIDGLPLYPGAEPKPEPRDKEPHRGSLNLDRVVVHQASAGKYETAAAASDILSFYRQLLVRYGRLSECTGGQNLQVSVRIDSEALRDLSVCRPSDFGHGETELKAGTRDDFRIVTVQPNASGSEFTLVHIQDAYSDQNSRK